jgi:hypothetical protein
MARAVPAVAQPGAAPASEIRASTSASSSSVPSLGSFRRTSGVVQLRKAPGHVKRQLGELLLGRPVRNVCRAEWPYGPAEACVDERDITVTLSRSGGAHASNLPIALSQVGV